MSIFSGLISGSSATIGGNVGIGTTNPITKLRVNDGSTRNFLVTSDAAQQGSTGIAIGSFNDNASAYAPLSIVGSVIFFNNNVGIGTINPTTKLQVVGDAQVSGSSGIFSVADRSTTGTGGFYRSAGINRLWDSTAGDVITWNTSGRVGIGTTLPTSSLHVIGTITAGTTNTSGRINFGTGDTGVAIYRDNTYDLVIQQHESSANPLYMVGAGDVRVSIDSNDNQTDSKFVVGNNNIKSTNELFSVNEAGNGYFSGSVGIGTTSPNTVFTVNQYADNNGITLANSGRGTSRIEWEMSGTNNEATSFLHNNNTNRYLMLQMARDYLAFSTNNTERMRLDASGNLGIGTTNPTAKLSVSGSIYSTVVNWGYPTQLVGGLNYGGAGLADIHIVQPNGQFRILNSPYSSALVVVNESNGNVGIGTTSPLAKLSVGTGSLSDTNVPVQISTPTATGQIYFGANKNGGYGALFGYDNNAFAGAVVRNVNNEGISFVTNNTSERVRILSDGNVGIGTTSPSNKLQIQGNVSASSYTSSIAGAVGFVGTASYAVNSANGVTINSNVDNYLVTATGTTGTLQGESNLTFDGTNLSTTGVLSSGTIRGTALYSRGSAASSGNILIQSDNGSSTAFWITAKTGGATLHIGGNGGSEPTAGAVIIDTSYNVGIGTAPTNNLDLYTTAVGTGGATIRSAGGGFLRMLPSASAGNYNSITSAGDTALIFSNGTQGQGRLVIAPWASATSGLVISGSSANVGIGTASPAYALDVNGDIRGNSWIGRSNIATPTADAALFRPADNSIALSTANTERVRINSSGNVGIGTTNPTTKLTVNGATTITGSSTIIGNLVVGQNSNSSTAARIDLTAGGNGFDSLIDFGYYDTFDASIWNIGRKGSTGAFFISNYSSGPEVNVVTINTSNNVGIGTTSPTAGYRLHVSGSVLSNVSSGNTSFVASTNNANAALNAIAGVGLELNTDSTNRNLRFSSNSSPLMFISGSGNVGIGTTSPSEKFEVYAGGLSVNSGTIKTVMSYASVGIVGTTTNHNLALYTNNSAKVTIDTSGNLGIGTTSPNTRLQVSSNIQGGSPSAAGTATTSSAYFTNSDTAYGILMGVLNAGHGWIQAQRTDTIATTYNLLLNPNGGNIGVGTTTPGAKFHVFGGDILRTNSDYVNGSAGSGFVITHVASSGNTDAQLYAFRGGNTSYGNIVIPGGSVGIGTTATPLAKLHVSAASTNDIIRLTRTTDSAGSGFIYANSNEMFGVHDGTNYPFLVRQGATTNTLVVSGSSVGIGTTSPGTKLQVGAGNTDANLLRLSLNYDTSRTTRAGIEWHDGSNTTGRISTEYDGTMVSMQFGSLYNSGYNSTTRMTIRGNGNVGIGTITPANTLQIQGNVSASSYTSSINNAVGFLGTASRAVIMDKIDVLSGGSTTGLGIYSGSFR